MCVSLFHVFNILGRIRIVYPTRCSFFLHVDPSLSDLAVCMFVHLSSYLSQPASHSGCLIPLTASPVYLDSTYCLESALCCTA